MNHSAEEIYYHVFTAEKTSKNKFLFCNQLIKHWYFSEN